MRRLYPLILVLLYSKLNEGAKPEDCLTGTRATTNGCEDENECEFGNRCGSNANCYNTNGSFYCLCEPGHRTRSKKVNFTEGQCKDINECLGDHQICGENTVCNNTIGSFTCTCAAGFVSSNGQKWLDVSQNVRCIDIDECKNRSLCGNNSECNNTPGSYYCTCDPGFLPSNKKETFNASQRVTVYHKNIDECLEDNICGHNAKCHNTPGSSYCTCNLGFRPSNGQKQFDVFESVTCEDINECKNQSLCGNNSECNNTPGSYFCMCTSGFVPSNKEDILNARQGVTCTVTFCALTSPANSATLCYLAYTDLALFWIVLVVMPLLLPE